MIIVPYLGKENLADDNGMYLIPLFIMKDYRLEDSDILGIV
jgi:hypothetical protein